MDGDKWGDSYEENWCLTDFNWFVSDISSASRVAVGDRLPGYQVMNLSNEQPGARVLLVRDGGLTGWGIRAKIFIDNKPVANMAAGEILEIRLANGDHVFGAVAVPQGLGQLNEVSIRISDKTQNYLRVGVSADGFRVLKSAALN